MISKGEINIKPHAKVLYCLMHEITKYLNREIGIYFVELSMGIKVDKLCFVRIKFEHTTSISEHPQDMNLVCQKPGLYFCETYE